MTRALALRLAAALAVGMLAGATLPTAFGLAFLAAIGVA